jgi:hypothetical protein
LEQIDFALSYMGTFVEHGAESESHHVHPRSPDAYRSRFAYHQYLRFDLVAAAIK